MVTTLVSWWLSGFDFDSRGVEAVLCFGSSVAAFVSGITCPLFDDKF